MCNCLSDEWRGWMKCVMCNDVSDVWKASLGK